MAFIIPGLASGWVDSPLPLQLPQELRLTLEQFGLVCQANPQAVLELAADGQLITMPPTGGDTGARNHSLNLALGLAARASGLRLKLFDSSTGFPPLCPDLVIELVSASDAGPCGAEALRRKMAAYLANGAQLGWLLFPEQRAVEIWQANGEGKGGQDAESSATTPSQRLESATQLEGGTLLPGLVLELEEIWAS